MQAVGRVLLNLALLIAAGLLSYDLARYYLYSPWTRDARVRADIVTVAPDVSGYVDDIHVRNNQFVHKGDILFVIDQERYRIALADAEATLAARQAQHLMALEQFQRRSKLSPGYTITVENLDNARRQSESAAAAYQQAIACRDNAAPHIHLGPTGAAHSCQGPHHARATRRVDQRGHDLHSRDKGRRGGSNRARHEESHDGNFWSTFELARCPSPPRAATPPSAVCISS